ncbi:IclR family transcriptional regulator [Turicimonas muris]
MNMENNSSKANIQVLDRASCILRVLTQHSEPVNLKVIAEETNLHISTCHRIITDLVKLRFVEKGLTSGTYRLGLRLLQLGNLVRERMSVREKARNSMVKLHNLTKQTVNLSIRQGDSIVYIDRIMRERPGIQVVRTIGATAPLHTTSSGKLFLAEDGFEKIRGYALRTNLEKNTPKSIGDIDTLLAEVSRVKALGFAHDVEELETGVHCIAAGIRDDSGKLVACLSISSPVSQMQDVWISELKHCADDISEHLGFVATPGELYVRPDFK